MFERLVDPKLTRFRLKHVMLAIVWIGANCAILRLFWLSGLPWYEFPTEAVLVNMVAAFWLSEENVYRRGFWCLVFVVLGIVLVAKLSVIPAPTKQEYRDTAILVESCRLPGP